MARNVSTIDNPAAVGDIFALPEAQPIRRLIEALKNNRTIVENCHFCRLPIEMESFENVSFRWHCQCGKSDGHLMGI